MNSPKLDYKKLIFLDGLRGLAALYVMIGHARWLLWEGFQQYSAHSADYTLWNKALVYFLTIFRYGHEAVLFFFVLSGFVIHLKYSFKIKTEPFQSFDFWNYLYRRAKRIYPPFLYALLITFLFDFLGNNILGFESIYSSNTLYPLINKNIHLNVQGTTFIGNLFFLIDAYVPAFGTNNPLWSLKYEWWFYMIYPLFWLISRRSIFLATAIMFILFIGSFFPSIWPIKLLQQIFGLMLSWWMGALLADIYTGRIKINFKWLTPLTILIIPSLLKWIVDPIISDTLIALGFSGIIAICFFLQEKNIELKPLNQLKWLGDMSYTLYVIHFPILVFISGWIIQRNTHLPSHFAWVAFGIITTMIFAWISHYIVEKPFLRKRT